MVLYQKDRIIDSYIPDLRASFEAYDASCCSQKSSKHDESSSIDDVVSDLRDVLFDDHPSDTTEQHIKVAYKAYKLRRMRNIQDVLHSSQCATPKSRSLWWNICLLARLRVAFERFKGIALLLPSFAEIMIILVPCPTARVPSSQRPLDLKQTFRILNLELTPATIQAVLGKQRDLVKTKREFTKRQKQKPYIHAEVQMLLFLNTIDSFASEFFPYLGCSKLSCFMCSHLLQSYGRLDTRGCHGRLFKPWTVPSVDRLVPGQADRIAKALKLVQKELKRTLKTPIGDKIKLQRTSVIGGSSIFEGRQEEQHDRQKHIDKLKMKADRERVAELFRR